MAAKCDIVGRIFGARVLATVCLVLLALLMAVGYLSYSTIAKTESAQKNLESNFQELSLQYSNLQSNLSILQSNYLDSQSNWSKLQQETALIQAQLANLKSRFNTSESIQNTILSQNEIFQTQFSNLQTNYTNFLTEYQTLGTAAPFSYLVFTDGKGKYYAENGTTQALDYSGTSGSQVGQKSIDALADSGGKIVFAGRINLDSPLTINSEKTKGLIEISGFGPSTQLISSGGNDCIDILGSKPFGDGGPYHVVIDNLVLTSETSPQGNFTNNGIYIKNWFDVNVENVMIFYANNSGIYIEDSANVHLNNVYVEGGSGTEYGGATPLNGVGFWVRGSKDIYFSQCFSDTNEIGFLFDTNPQTNNVPTNVFLTESEATLSQHQGISIANTYGMVLSSSLIEGSNNDGIMIIDSFRVSIIDALIWGNAGNGITITSQSTSMSQSQITIKDCTISSNGKNGIGIWAKNGQAISQVNIEGCTVTDSGTSARGNPRQPDIWDGINISNDAVSGGNCTYVTISSSFLGNDAGGNQNQKYGIRSLQNSDYIQVFNNNFFSNISGNYTLIGNHNSVWDNIDG